MFPLPTPDQNCGQFFVSKPVDWAARLWSDVSSPVTVARSCGAGTATATQGHGYSDALRSKLCPASRPCELSDSDDDAGAPPGAPPDSPSLAFASLAIPVRRKRVRFADEEGAECAVAQIKKPKARRARADPPKRRSAAAAAHDALTARLLDTGETGASAALALLHTQTFADACAAASVDTGHATYETNRTVLLGSDDAAARAIVHVLDVVERGAALAPYLLREQR